ncbi:hypothetical protein Tco_0552953 [Tanacetum coccineum]
MSDSEGSTVTYTEVSSPFEVLSDIGSMGVDGLPMIPEDPYAYVVAAFQAPLSPDYVPGPEEPEQAPPSPEFVPQPVYPKFMPPKDEMFPAEEQPLPAAVSPTTDSPGYIANSDPEEDEEDPKEDPTDYLAGEGDDDDDDDESSDDDEDDDDDDDVEEDEDEEEEVEHPAPADSVPPSVHRVMARMSVPSIMNPYHSFSYCGARLLDTPSHNITSLPMVITHFPQISSPLTSSVSKVTLPPRKRLCIALGPRYEVGESSSAPTARPTGGFRADYGFDEMVEDMQGTPAATDVAGLSQRMTDFVTTVRQDTYEIYVRLDDAQDERLLMSGRHSVLHRDRRAHARTTRLMETESRLSREAWVQSMDASDIARSEVRALRTTVLVHHIEITALRAADRARQAQLVEALTLMST